MPDPAVGVVSGLVGDAGHLVEELELGTHGAGRAGRGGGGRLHLGVLLGGHRLLGQRRPFVVRAWRGGEQRQSLGPGPRCLRHGRLLGLPLHPPVVDIQGSGDGFN